LAKSIRKKLKTMGIYSGIKMIFSEELSTMSLMPLKEHQKIDPGSYKVYSNYRLRTVPVMGCMPAMMGQAMAAAVLCEIAGVKMEVN
jgi:tRNA A37 threonylcarbamoyladenosine dehydratase